MQYQQDAMQFHLIVTQLNAGQEGIILVGNTALNQIQVVQYSSALMNCRHLQCKVPPRLELGSLDSKSKVLTIAPRHP